MRVYRDCNPGTAGMALSQTVEIRDLTTNINVQLTLSRIGPFPHSLDTSHCIVVPAGICIEFYEFTNTITLPPTSRGYSLHLSNCCRNGLIQNIPSPTGVNYYWNANIPANDTVGNSSPEFLTPPPVLLCLNQPLTDTLHTRDIDGDSLHFELCEIYRYNASQGGVLPVPFNTPFNSSFPMPASPPFGIDPITGQLKGTPNQIGHYVVGICVTDYRNGVPLSTVRLDYQFNVTPCYTIVSDILTNANGSTIHCAGLTVNFTGQTQNASTFFWDFGDTNILSDTSNTRHPTFTYSLPGSYQVMLIAEPGDRCADTAYAIFEVYDIDTVEILRDSSYCFDNQPVQIGINSSYDSTASYFWNFGNAATPQMSTLKVPPPVSWSSSGNHQVQLMVRRGKCSWMYQTTIEILPKLEADMIIPSENPQMNCGGLTLRFISESKNAHSVKWNFGDLSTLSDTSNQDTAYYTFPKEGFYLVSLVASQESGCTDSTSYLFEVFPELNPQISVTGQLCFEAQQVNLEATGKYPKGTSFRWDLGPTASLPVVKNPSAPRISWLDPGAHIVTLTVNKGSCVAVATDTVDIPQWSVPVNAGPDTTIKYRQLVRLSGSPSDQYYWFSDHVVGITNPFAQTTTSSIPTSNDTVLFYLKVTDANGCQGIDTLKVYVLADPSGGGFNVLTPNGDGRNDYLDLSEYMLGRDCDFTILNRWGSEVYHADKYGNDWAGTDDRGRPLPDGTYYYILFCDRTVTAKGPITIINSDHK